MSYPKAMLSQLTDLDDSELDEQAGVFNFSKKSAPPSPKVFFNPTSVFLDVPDYRETVSQSKRFTIQNPPAASTASRVNNTVNQSKSFLGNSDYDGNSEEVGPYPEGKINKFLKSQRASSRNAERSLSVETSKPKKDTDSQKDHKGRRHNRVNPQVKSKDKIDKNGEGGTRASTFAANLASRMIHRNGSESDSNDSDEHEEYIYKLGPCQESNRQLPLFKSKGTHQDETEHINQRALAEDTDTDGAYSLNSFNPRPGTTSRQKGNNYKSSYCGSAKGQIENDLDSKAHRKLHPKFSSDSHESRIPSLNDRFAVQNHRQVASFDQERNRPLHTFRKAYIDDLDFHDETLPLVWNMRRGMREYSRSRRSSLEISLIPFLCFLTLVSLSLALFSVSNIALVDVSVVSFGNILATKNELSFDLNIKASNWNIWDVYIQEVNLAIYATPFAAPGNSTINPQDFISREFLGNITLLQDPLVFSSGSIWQGRGLPSTASSLVRLSDPGIDDPLKNKTSTWPEIMQGAYTLTVRGSLPHKLLFQRKLARICAFQRVESSSDLPPALATPCSDNSFEE